MSLQEKLVPLQRVIMTIKVNEIQIIVKEREKYTLLTLKECFVCFWSCNVKDEETMELCGLLRFGSMYPCLNAKKNNRDYIA